MSANSQFQCLEGREGSFALAPRVVTRAPWISFKYTSGFLPLLFRTNQFQETIHLLEIFGCIQHTNRVGVYSAHSILWQQITVGHIAIFVFRSFLWPHAIEGRKKGYGVDWSPATAYQTLCYMLGRQKHKCLFPKGIHRLLRETPSKTNKLPFLSFSATNWGRKNLEETAKKFVRVFP